MSATSFARGLQDGNTIYTLGVWCIVPVAKSSHAGWTSSVAGDPYSVRKHASIAEAKQRVLSDAPNYVPTIYEDRDENGQGIGQAFQVGKRVVACFEQNQNAKIVGLNLAKSNLILVFDNEADEIEMTVNYCKLEGAGG